MARAGELRRHARIADAAPLQIIWKDRTGVDKFIHARTLDICETGMRIEVREPIEKQTYVTLLCPAFDLHGTASVRTCSRKDMKYIVGLEFSGGLRWKAKAPPE